MPGGDAIAIFGFLLPDNNQSRQIKLLKKKMPVYYDIEKQCRVFESPEGASRISAPQPTTATQSASASMERVSYSNWAGVSRIPTATVDKFGNAMGDEFDLVKDGSFDNEKIYVLNCTGFPIDPYKNALKRKGFSLIEDVYAPGAQTLKSILKDTSQFWLISGTGHPLENTVVSVIQDYFEEGHGLYLWGDNDPYFVHSNQISQRLFGTTMSGNSPGDQVISLYDERKKNGVIPNHLISTGIVNIYEGGTIAEVHTNKLLTPLIYGSNGKVLAAYYDQDGKRVIIDGGFTRLYYKWDSAGTDRYIVNAAVWLVNMERFGANRSRRTG